jgi:hypothetical protein
MIPGKHSISKAVGGSENVHQESNQLSYANFRYLLYMDSGNIELREYLQIIMLEFYHPRNLVENTFSFCFSSLVKPFFEAFLIRYNSFQVFLELQVEELLDYEYFYP